MKNLKWLIVLLMFLSIGSFLPAVHADEQNKDVPPMPGRAKPPPNIGHTTAGPPQARSPMPSPTQTDSSMHGRSIPAAPKPANPPVPAKTGPPPMPPPPKPGKTVSVPTQAGMPGHSMPGTTIIDRSMHGHQITNVPQGQSVEEHHEAEHRKGHRAEIHHFTGRDYHHWNERERAIWRGGEWRHEKYMGRFGWWWSTGGMLYFYEEPEYPYPQAVPDAVYEIPDDDQLPQDYIQEPIEDPNYYWYFCEDPKGYYPYIPECPGGWTTVVPPTQPPDQ